MLRILALCALTMLTSCRTTGACAFSPQAEGWVPIDSVPEALARQPRQAGRWYASGNDEYLFCANGRSRDLCGGIYETYRVSSGEYIRQDLIVCTE